MLRTEFESSCIMIITMIIMLIIIIIFSADVVDLVTGRAARHCTE